MKIKYHISITVIDDWIETIDKDTYNLESKVFIYNENLDVIDIVLIKDLIEDKIPKKKKSTHKNISRQKPVM